MDKKQKTGEQIAEVTTKIVAVLEPLSSEERRKVIGSAFIILGEDQSPIASKTDQAVMQGAGKHEDDGPTGMPVRAKTWANQQQLKSEDIDRVFDFSDQGVAIIAGTVPGKNDKERTHNAYALHGLGRFLATGETGFEDKDARTLCEQLGCYNSANHSAYMSDRGNILTGSKASGWRLTAPGLKHAADLVKQIAKE